MNKNQHKKLIKIFILYFPVCKNMFGIAQLREQKAKNPCDGGSIPTFKQFFYFNEKLCMKYVC